MEDSPIRWGDLAKLNNQVTVTDSTLLAIGNYKYVACLTHWKKAIITHQAAEAIHKIQREGSLCIYMDIYIYIYIFFFLSGGSLYLVSSLSFEIRYILKIRN